MNKNFKRIAIIVLSFIAVLVLGVYTLFIGSATNLDDKSSSNCESVFYINEIETTTSIQYISLETTTNATITTKVTEVDTTGISDTTDTTDTTNTSPLVTTTSTTHQTAITSTTTVTLTTVEPVINTTVTKDVHTVAQEVWQGLWGTGEERKNALESAGYDYLEIQSIVEIIKAEYEESHPQQTSGNISFVKTFSRGTYYCYGGARNGGSGRALINCAYGNGEVKGSIASSYLYRNYGYNYNGKRTMVYLEISGYPSMNGYYYLDDSDAGNPNVIDFFYYYSSECPFRNQGVVSVNCSIVY